MQLDYLTIHTNPSPIRRGFAPGFVNYKKRCTRFAAASDKVYLLDSNDRWFSPGTPASSNIKTARFISKISHINTVPIYFSSNVRPILVVSKYPPLLDTTLLIYRFGLSPFIILVTIPLLELLTYHSFLYPQFIDLETHFPISI